MDYKLSQIYASRNPKQEISMIKEKSLKKKTFRNDADERIGSQSVRYGTLHRKKMVYMTWRAKRAK